MKLKVPQKRGGAFIPAPAGTHNAVCVDCVEVKDVERSYGGKSWKEDQVMFVFQIEKRISEADVKVKLAAWPDASPEQVAETKKLIGQRFSVRTFGMKASMDPKAKLRAMVESWLGKTFAVNEEFDPETLVGAPCFLTVVHKIGGENKDRTYANITTVSPVMKDDEGNPFKPAIAPENYVRQNESVANALAGEPENDEDIPF